MCDEPTMCRNCECDVDGSLMGSRCHTSGMRIQSHAGVTLLPVYMPRSSYPRASRSLPWSDLREPTIAISSLNFVCLPFCLSVCLSTCLSVSHSFSLFCLSMFVYSSVSACLLSFVLTRIFLDPFLRTISKFLFFQARNSFKRFEKKLILTFS